MTQKSDHISKEKVNLVAKYNQERDKRLRADGINQYIDVRSSEIQDLAKDPWVDYSDSRIQNPPLRDGSSVKFLITGAGHSGLLFACRLAEAGFDGKDIVCVDVAGGFGGTWYWNRYPGLMCDIESYCYLPLVEETGYMPKHKYSFGEEIRGQSERAAKQYGIQGQFCTKIDSQVWDDERELWIVSMTRTLGDDFKPESLSVFAEFVFFAGGVLHIPKIPKLPGWEGFRKNKIVFHSARWNYDYTGGTQEKPELTKLKNKKVAIIGTGATAIQIVPELAKWAEHVYVVQRTPSYNGYRGNRLTDEKHFKDLSKEKGWQNTRRVNFNAWVSNYPDGYGPNLVDDGWTHTPAGAGLMGSKRKIVEDVDEHIKYLLELDQPRTESLRKRIDDVVKDKETAEALKPWYGSWCKRPTFHDEYLGTFNRPNVTLIDTDGKGLDAFSEQGLVHNGKEHPIDALVLATGFANPTGASDRAGASITGRNGRGANGSFQDNAPLYGLAMQGFPNMFGVHIRGGGTSWNITSTYDVVARQAAHIVKVAHARAKPGQRVVIDVTPEAANQWGDEVAKRAKWYSALAVCTPSYFTAEGATSKAKTAEEAKKAARLAGWGSGPVDFQERVEVWQARGDLNGFEVRVVSPQRASKGGNDGIHSSL